MRNIYNQRYIIKYKVDKDTNIGKKYLLHFYLVV